MHFRTELSCEKDLNDEYRGVIESLDQLYQDVGRQIGDLESSLKQIDKYQHEVQLLKQKLVQEEQLLKTMGSSQPDANDQQMQVGDFFISYQFNLCTFIHSSLKIAIIMFG